MSSHILQALSTAPPGTDMGPTLQLRKPSVDREAISNTAISQEPDAEISGEATGEGTDAPQGDEPATIDWKARLLSLPLLVSVGEFDFEDFKNRWGEHDRYHVIELLMGSDRISEEVSREEARRVGTLSRKRQRELKTKSSTGDTWIQRIRIHSPILLHHLKEAMDAPDWNFEQPRVFFRPFKALIHYHSHVKKTLELLEMRLGDAKPREEEDGQNGELTIKSDESVQHQEPGDQEGNVAAKGDETTELDDPDKMHDMTALEHLRCYVNFMDTRIMPMEDMFNGTDHRMVRFDELWHLFKVGDILYAPISVSNKAPAGIKSARGRYQTAFMLYFKGVSVIDNSEPDDIKMKERTITLWCYHLDYDGESYGPVKQRIIVESFAGQKDIRELAAYPIRFAANADKLQEDWALQGKRFRRLVEEKHVSCEGWTLTEPPLGTFERNDEEMPQHIESDVIVDFGEALRRQPSWKPEFEAPDTDTVNDWKHGLDSMTVNHWPDPSVTGKAAEEPWFGIQECTQRDDDSEESLKRAGVDANAFLHEYNNGAVKSLDGLDESTNNLLLPRRFFVYILRQRRFAMVDIFSLRVILPQSTIFDDLRIDVNHKLIVQSLVADHFEKRRIQRQHPIIGPVNQDLVRGKGSGLFILLHGVPGVGKTATAEAVAQANNKPLFTITCGDLGLTPEAVDSKLNEVFRLAHLWDCVLLLDEADIFLARRDTFNLKRNALVSVFLRVLEYYSGILFLTTNRVGILDEAFKSRIHISLYYEPLSRLQTVEIFRVNIKRSREIEDEKQRQLQGTDLEQPRLRIMAKSIIDYAQRYYDEQEDTPHLRWNGRQIRNAFQIASSLAHYNMRKTSLGAGDNLTSGQVASPVLDDAQFERVAEAIERFGNYMDYTKAMTDADQARIETIRADDIRNDDLAPRRREYGAPGPSRGPTSAHDRRYDADPYQQRGASAFGQIPSPNPGTGSVKAQGKSRASGQAPSGRNTEQMKSGAARMSEAPTWSPRPRPQAPPQSRSAPTRTPKAQVPRVQPSQGNYLYGEEVEEATERFDTEARFHGGQPGGQGQDEIFGEEDVDDVDDGRHHQAAVVEVDGDDYDD